MPYSDPANKSWAEQKLRDMNFKSVLDVGAGAGAYGKLARAINPEALIDAIEVWTPYIAEFGLHNIYNNVFNYEAKDHNNWAYDVVIFGDVLEHMSKDEAFELYKRASEQCSYILFSIPIVHLPQGAWGGNPYETHVTDHWHHEDILQEFNNLIDFAVYPVTGIYLAKF